jgi:hypothetical protein
LVRIAGLGGQTTHHNDARIRKLNRACK